MTASLIDDEQKRLAAVEEYRLLDADPEDAYADIVHLAAFICRTPIAAVSLVDDRKQWFKASVGLSLKDTPRDVAFCAHAILQPDVLVVKDAQADPRFADNPLVAGDPNIRFYAGAPLVTAEGFVLGSLCVIDRVPRVLTARQKAVLSMLARQVAGRIELKRRIGLQEQSAAEQERLLEERVRTEETLRRSEEELQAVVDQAMDGIYLFDLPTRRLLKTNAALRAMLGYSEEQAALLTVYDIVGHDRASIDRNLERLAVRGEMALDERQYLRQDGSVLVAEVHARVIRHGGGEAFCVVVSDLTERRQAEAAQHIAERDYRSLFTNMVEGVFRATPAGAFLQVNPALARLYGYQSPEAMIRELRDIGSQLYVDSERRAEFQRLMQKREGVSDFESQVCRRDGKIIWISESARPVYDAAGGVCWYEGFVQDISERKAREARREQELRDAQERADLDPLTGLLNHRAFHRRLDEESNRARRGGTALAVVMLDLDHFKFFNDAYGHSIGDQVLLQVAERLRTVCRSYDTLARFGGDEFALLLPGIEAAARSEIEARLRMDLSGLTFTPAGSKYAIPIGLSVGLAVFPGNSAEQSEALQQADERMQRSKLGMASETEADLVRAGAASAVTGFSMLNALVTAVDNKDRYTRRHSEDVLTYSLIIAQEMGMDEAEQQTVSVAALLHDVGKIGVPDAILRKPGILTKQEFEIVQQHPTMGAAIVGAVPGLEGTLDAVRHHHERWDGGGYPAGLCGEETPRIARLMAVADAFSAMTADRPYRRGMTRDEAMSILEAGAGTQWDPVCVDAFRRGFARPLFEP